MLNSNLVSVTTGINYLKIYSLLTVLWFTFLFNIERLDINGETLINLPNATYAVAVIIGLSLLSFPNLQRVNFIVLLAIFFGLEQALHGFIEWGDFSVVRLGQEFMSITVTLWLMRSLSFHLQNTEEGMDDIMLTDAASHVVSIEEAAYRAEEEIVGLRHLNRSMSFVYCTLSSDDANFLNLTTSEEILNWNLNQMFEFRTRQVDLGRRIMALTYVGDIIFEYRNGIGACLLEVDEEEVKNFLYRLYQFVRKFKNLTLWAGVATYPNDGTTFEELLGVATNNLIVFESEEDESLNDTPITGDVKVGLRERIKIERDSTWVNKLAYQSVTSRAIYRPAKRMMDILVSGVALIALSPLLLMIAVLVVINDGFPIFFSHNRVGLGGKPFKMYKFRSMYRNAPPLEPVIVELADGSKRIDWPDKTDNDPRVTLVGRYLRKWSLDELPQLWNVFKGDMSLIGPRPSSWSLDKHTLMQTARLTVKPGITGLWQVSARDSKNFDERVLWDLKYVRKMSLWLDIQILARTIGAVIRKTGA